MVINLSNRGGGVLKVLHLSKILQNQINQKPLWGVHVINRLITKAGLNDQ